MVESSGNKFLKSGHPVVRFEGHKMLQYYKKEKGYTTAQLKKDRPDLFYDYKKNDGRDHGIKTFNLAYSYDPNAAVYGSSFGFGQVMGFNYKDGGFKSLQDFYTAQFTIEGQIQAFIGFLTSSPTLISHLKNKNFTAFAAGYNGPAYVDNKYDTKMQNNYDQLSK